MSERIALIADIHGNSPALRAVLDDARWVGCARLFVLGDIVNGLDPGGCVDLLLSWPEQVSLKGNAEFYMLTPELEVFPLREEPLYEELIRLIDWWRARLSPSHLAWLEALPDRVVWKGACLVHDSPLDRYFPERRHQSGLAAHYQELCFHARGLTPDQDAAALQPLLEWMVAQRLSHVFCGHTHVPFCRSIEDVHLCNVGSVGLPLDGDPRAAWVVLDEGTGGSRAMTIRRVSYPIEQTLDLVAQTPDYPSLTRPGMRAAYERMLTTGIHWKVHLARASEEAARSGEGKRPG